MMMTPVVVLSSAVTILAVVVYIAAVFVVGRMRGKHNVQAPAVTGAPEFERAYRVQANTLEQMAAFLPLLWIASIFPVWIGYLPPALGLVWVLGRVLYMSSYLADAAKRGLGFNISALATLALLVLAVIGVVRALMPATSSPI
jgi:glutathione S-transferase